MDSIEQLEGILGIQFRDKELLLASITHRSYVNEHRKSAQVHNERLEFLGDAVLELAVTEHLYGHYEHSEGVLTNWRSALVKTESLREVAEALQLDRFIRLSRGERRGTERARAQIISDAVEAVIGAIYLDQGYATAAQFVEKYFITRLPDIIKSGAWLDSKTRLQEVSQEMRGQTPHYKVLAEVGPDHDKRFTVGVVIGKKLIGRGSGSSKQEAQQAAAASALAKMLPETPVGDVKVV